MEGLGPTLYTATPVATHTAQDNAIAQLIQDVASNLPGRLLLHSEKIKSHAQQSVKSNANNAGENTCTLTQTFYMSFLSDVIVTATNNNDIDDIDAVKQSILLLIEDTNRSDFTKKLIFGCCQKGVNEDASIRMLDFLYDIKADFSCFDSSGDTPLLVALDNFLSITMIDKLIASGADVNQSSENGRRLPLKTVCIWRNATLVKQLLDAKAIATFDGLGEVLEYIVGQAKDWHKILSPSLEIIKMLVAAGMPVDIDANGKTPLKLAVLNGSLAVVEVLIDLHATIYPDMFDDAIRSGDENFLKALVGKKLWPLSTHIPHGTINHCWKSAISLSIFQLCLDSGLSLENFSLADSVVLRTPKAVRECLARDKNLNIAIPYIHVALPTITIPGSYGCSLAHYAAVFANSESLAILIAAGLDISARDSQGLTPLHYAAAYSRPNAVKLLIFAGAEIDVVDSNGMTPLHWAVERSDILCAEVLLYAGAKSGLTNKANKTPLECVGLEGLIDIKLAKWNKVFIDTKPRKPNVELTLDSQERRVPSLQEIGVNAIVNAPKISDKLSYRDVVSDELALEIEAAAIKQMTPPKLPSF